MLVLWRICRLLSKRDPRFFEKMIKDADENGDGEIEFDEFRTIMEKFFK